MPAVGLGTWQSKPNEVREAVKAALRAGYRHIDTALAYGNEHEVGQGIKDSGVPREEIWITTKLDNPWHKRVEEGITSSLKDLGVDYVETTSCYDPDPAGAACGRCDACQLRRRGFAEAGVPDPTRYAAVFAGA